MIAPEKINLFSDRQLILKPVLAVQPLDGYSSLPISGNTAHGLSVWAGRLRPVRNLSGYFVFNEWPADQAVLEVDCPGFFPVKRVVKSAEITKLGKWPLLSPVLTPAPNYPFPVNATLVRGIVKTKQGVAAVGISITATGTGAVAQTDVNGEFALFFINIKSDHIETDPGNGNRYVLGDQGRRIRIDADSAQGKASILLDSLEMGVCTNLPSPMLLK